MTAAPDDTLMPPGFGELRLTTGSLTLWGGVDSRDECALPTMWTLCATARHHDATTAMDSFPS